MIGFSEPLRAELNKPYRPSRLLLQWHLTERCNLRCAHCYQDDFRDSGRSLADWLSILEQYRAFLREGTASAGGKGRSPIKGQLTLTGGEPFAHPDFPALLDRIAGMRDELGFAILCNGTLIDDAMARQLAAWSPRFVQVSLEGTPATHDALRGHGNHAAVVAAIKRLVSAGIRTLIAFTAHQGNYREFPEVARLGKKLGVARVWADRLIPQGQGGRLRGLSVEETCEFVELMRQSKLELAPRWPRRRGEGTEISLHRALQFLGGGPAYRCSAGDTLITVMPDGTLYPCRRLPITAGNLYQTPLGTLYDGELLKKLRDSEAVTEGCASCAYERLCRGGLRCLAYAVTGRFDAADPGCWLTAAATTAAASPTAATAV